MCEFCSGLVGGRNSDCTLMCIYCNVVVHRNCLMVKRRSISSSIPMNARIRNTSWVCFYCIESLTDSEMKFEQEQNTAKNYQIMVKAQTVIAKYWRRRMDRKKYLMIYKVVLKLQVWFRLRRKRRVYMRKKLQKLRVIKITIEHAENLLVCGDKTFQNSSKAEKAASNSYYVVIAAVDQARGFHNQTWHDFSTTTSFPANSKLTHQPSVPFNSQHVLPGVSALQTIMLSVIQKGKRDYFLGQVSLNLQQDNLWMKGGTLQKELEEVQHLVKDKSGQDMKFNYSPSPQGQLKIRLQVFLGMKSECGSVLGSHIEDFIRVLSKLPATSAFLYHNSMVADSLVSKGASNSSLVAASSTPVGSSSSVTAASPSQDIKLPLVQAPDAASMTAHGAKKRLWVAMVEGYLFIYQHYGGPFRLTLNISQFDYSIQPCHQGAVFSLHKFGYPSFHFQTLEKTDYFRWKCALICNFRYVVDPQAEFNTDQLIQDIVKVNAAYMPQQKPQHLLLRANSTLQIEHTRAAKADNRNKDGHTRGQVPFLKVAKKQSSYSDLKPPKNKATELVSDIEDSMVELRHSVKQRVDKSKSTGALLPFKRSKMLSSVLAVNVLDDKLRSASMSQAVDNNESMDATVVRASLSALNVLDEDAINENLYNESFTAAAELFARLVYSKDIDQKIKV